MPGASLQYPGLMEPVMPGVPPLAGWEFTQPDQTLRSKSLGPYEQLALTEPIEPVVSIGFIGSYPDTTTGKKELVSYGQQSFVVLAPAVPLESFQGCYPDTTTGRQGLREYPYFTENIKPIPPVVPNMAGWIGNYPDATVGRQGLREYPYFAENIIPIPRKKSKYADIIPGMIAGIIGENSQ